MIKNFNFISLAESGKAEEVLILVASGRALHRVRRETTEKKGKGSSLPLILFLESAIGSPSVDVSLDLAKRAQRTEKGHHVVVTNGSRNAVSSPVEGPHCDTCSAQTAFIHIRCNLTRKAREAKCAAETDTAVAETVTHARLPVGVLRYWTACNSRLSYNDHWRRRSLHFRCRTLSRCGS